MAEYIKKDDVLEYMRSRLDMQYRYLPILFMDLVIDEMPAADVRENIKGEWIKCNYLVDNVYLIDENEFYRCNKCHQKQRKAHNYCPNCGAAMSEKKDD